MRKLLLFVVESKSEKENSDSVYLKATINYFYENDRGNIMKYVFMNGKGNYAKNSTLSKIDDYIKKAKRVDSNTDVKVYYVFDKDQIHLSSDDIEFMRKVESFCEMKGYSAI